MTSRRPSPSSAITAPTGPSAVRSALVRAIDAAAVRIAAGRSLSTEDVHDTRKRIKRARAAFRVLRPALDEDVYSGCDRLLRAAGRSLSTARDAAVLAQTNARLRARLEGAPPPKTHHEPTKSPGASTADAARAHRNLRRAAATLAGARVRRRGWKPLGSGVRAVYKRGRRLAAAVEQDATTEALHAWRRHAKRYWHVLEIFEVVNPARLAPIIGDARPTLRPAGRGPRPGDAGRVHPQPARPRLQTRDVALLQGDRGAARQTGAACVETRIEGLCRPRSGTSSVGCEADWECWRARDCADRSASMPGRDRLEADARPAGGQDGDELANACGGGHPLEFLTQYEFDVVLVARPILDGPALRRAGHRRTASKSLPGGTG